MVLFTGREREILEKLLYDQELKPTPQELKKLSVHMKLIRYKLKAVNAQVTYNRIVGYIMPMEQRGKARDLLELGRQHY